MTQTSMLARIVAVVGDVAITWRRMQGPVPEQAVGPTPAIPAARSQGRMPTLKMPTARGWRPGQTPVAALGLKVKAFAGDLKHPRWICVLPNEAVEEPVCDSPG